MEDLVTSLETAKKLKAAGFPEKAVYWWNPAQELHHKKYSLERGHSEIVEWDDPKKVLVDSVAAPTAQEIADQLRQTGSFEMRSSNHGKSIDAWLWVTDLSGRMFHGYGDTMAEALAQLWIKLNEENAK